MRATIVVSCWLSFATIAVVAQERAVLDSRVARPEPRHHIIAGGASVVIGGILDGEPKHVAAKLNLDIESLSIVPPGTPTDSAAGNNVVDYELRLVNVSTGSVMVPIGTDVDAAVDRCGNSRIEESSVGVELQRDGGRGWVHMPGRQSYWFGCAAVADTMLSLQPNEWITYKGTVRLPPTANLPSSAMARWMLSDVTFSTGSEGLKQYTTEEMSVTSPEHVLQ